jgi:hypothetical protein
MLLYCSSVDWPLSTAEVIVALSGRSDTSNSTTARDSGLIRSVLRLLSVVLTLLKVLLPLAKT